MSKAEKLASFRSAMISSACDIYDDIYSDLPSLGNEHYVSAVDFIKDRLYEKYRLNPLFPRVNLNSLVKIIGIEDDRKQSRATKARKEKPIKAPKVKSWDELPPKRKGVGSF